MLKKKKIVVKKYGGKKHDMQSKRGLAEQAKGNTTNARKGAGAALPEEP